MSLGILILLIGSSANITCRKTQIELIPIGADRVIGKLENGNLEVTPAFVIKKHYLEYKVKRLKLELEKCREEKKQ